MSREALRMLPGSSKGLVRKYIDKAGKRRHVGVPDKLKGSQCLAECIACHVLEFAVCVSVAIYIYVAADLRAYTAEFGECIATVAATPKVGLQVTINRGEVCDWTTLHGGGASMQKPHYEQFLAGPVTWTSCRCQC